MSYIHLETHELSEKLKLNEKITKSMLNNVVPSYNIVTFGKVFPLGEDQQVFSLVFETFISLLSLYQSNSHLLCEKIV